MSVTIPKVAADFETSLNASVAVGDTTATLLSATDEDGVVLASGTYAFTIDNDTDYKEYIVCSLVGTALTGISSISRQGVATTGFANYHRRGASVQITDWAVLYRVVANLTGVLNLDSGVPLSYDGTPALGSSNQLATVQYVLDHINGGAVSFNAEIVAGMAGETLTTGQWVYLKVADGRWYKTAANDITKCLGVRVGKALGAGSAGGAISGGVFVSGLETTGTYTAFTTYYLSDTAGALATSAGTNSVAVGTSDGNSKLLVSVISKSNLNALAGSVGTPSTANAFITQQGTFTDIDQTQTTQNGSTSIGEANATTKKNKLAQSFIPTLQKMRGVRLYKAADSGSFTGTVSVALQADSGGSPSGSDLATVTITNAAWLKLAVGEFQAQFASEYSAIAIQSLYWIVITTSTSDNTNHINIGTNSAGGYANGTLKFNNTTDGWVLISGFDMYFRTLGGTLAQVPITDSTTGLTSNQTTPNSSLLFDVTSGTTVASTTAETTSYTSTFDSTCLNKIGNTVKIRFNVSGNNDTNAATVTFRLKLNSVTLLTYATIAGSANSIAFNALFEAYISTTALGTQAYIYSVNGGTNTYLATATTQFAYGIVASGRGTLAATLPSSSALPIVVTVQPSANSAAVSGTCLDMLVQQM
jgi:hypothetical protein